MGEMKKKNNPLWGEGDWIFFETTQFKVFTGRDISQISNIPKHNIKCHDKILVIDKVRSGWIETYCVYKFSILVILHRLNCNQFICHGIKPNTFTSAHPLSQKGYGIDLYDGNIEVDCSWGLYIQRQFELQLAH